MNDGICTAFEIAGTEWRILVFTKEQKKINLSENTKEYFLCIFETMDMIIPLGYDIDSLTGKIIERCKETLGNVFKDAKVFKATKRVMISLNV